MPLNSHPSDVGAAGDSGCSSSSSAASVSVAAVTAPGGEDRAALVPGLFREHNQALIGFGSELVLTLT
jgi:hypothetical protein